MLIQVMCDTHRNSVFQVGLGLGLVLSICKKAVSENNIPFPIEYNSIFNDMLFLLMPTTNQNIQKGLGTNNNVSKFSKQLWLLQQPKL